MLFHSPGKRRPASSGSSLLMVETQLPSLFICLEGFFVWLNFQVSGSNRFYIYYPVVLTGLVVTIVFFPAPVLYHRGRRWLVYSNVSFSKTTYIWGSNFA